MHSARHDSTIVATRNSTDSSRRGSVGWIAARAAAARGALPAAALSGEAFDDSGSAAIETVADATLTRRSHIDEAARRSRAEPPGLVQTRCSPRSSGR